METSFVTMLFLWLNVLENKKSLHLSEVQSVDRSGCSDRRVATGNIGR